MSIAVSPEIEDRVHTLVASGQYRDESEVVGEALRLLERRNQLRVQIQIGLDELDRGERLDGDEVFRELEAKAEAIERQSP